MKVVTFHLNSAQLILFILTTAFFTCFGQEPEQLKIQLAKLENGKKIDQYLKIGTLYAEKYGLADSLLLYADYALTLSNKINNQRGINKSLFHQAIALEQKGDFKASLVILHEIIPSVKKLDDSILEGDVYNHLGFCYYATNDNEHAVEFFLKAVKIFDREKYYDGLAFSYCKLSALFSSENQADDAVLYKNKARNLITKISDPYTKMTLYNSLSGLYTQIQVDDRSLNYLDSTIYCAKKALVLMKELGYYPRASQIYNSISDAYFMKAEYAKSLEYCKESFKYRSYLLPGEIIMSYLKYSDCSNLLGNHTDALIYLDSVKIEVDRIKDVYYEMAYYERVYEYNKVVGNFEVALEGLQRLKFLQDSVFDVEKSASINELNQKYQKVENEKKISELNKENELAALNVKFLIVGIIITILVIVIIVFFYRQSVLKNKFKLLETEQRLNRARMNPHFFFNALASIHALSEVDTKQKDVPRLIAKFSKIMRQSLESTYDELVSIEEEIDFIQNYIELQKTRYPSKFDYEIIFSDNLALDELKIPSMLLQPFIENTIEHGFKNIGHKGMLSIGFYMESTQLKVVCKDNGEGIKSTDSIKSYPSRATQIVRERLLLLNEQYKSSASFELVNHQNTGVEIIVFLPFLK
ncbi:MAG: histidine kinase [Bacteroidota bacterium]